MRKDKYQTRQTLIKDNFHTWEIWHTLKINYVWTSINSPASGEYSMHRPNIFRLEGTVVVFGLTKLYTKECTYTHNFSFSRWLERGGDDGGGVEERAGGNQRCYDNASPFHASPFYWSPFDWSHWIMGSFYDESLCDDRSPLYFMFFEGTNRTCFIYIVPDPPGSLFPVFITVSFYVRKKRTRWTTTKKQKRGKNPYIRVYIPCKIAIFLLIILFFPQPGILY